MYQQLKVWVLHSNPPVKRFNMVYLRKTIE
jgi:hypothetical protein